MSTFYPCILKTEGEKGKINSKREKKESLDSSGLKLKVLSLPFFFLSPRKTAECRRWRIDPRGRLIDRRSPQLAGDRQTVSPMTFRGRTHATSRAERRGGAIERVRFLRGKKKNRAKLLTPSARRTAKLRRYSLAAHAPPREYGRYKITGADVRNLRGSRAPVSRWPRASTMARSC